MASRACFDIERTFSAVLRRMFREKLFFVPLLAAFSLVLSSCDVDRLLGSSNNNNGGGNNNPPQRVLSLRFATQPRTTMAGEKINPPIRVVVEDQNGQIASDFTGVIRLSLSGDDDDDDDDVELRGNTEKRAEAGSVTFEDLSIRERGNGYIIRAEAEGASATTSSEFGITSGKQRRLNLVAGDDQEAQVGATLDPYVVRVVDEFGNPISGELLNWTVASGGGAVSPQTSLTDARGESRALHTLGPQAGDQFVRTSLAEDPSSVVTFSASAEPGAPARLVILQQPGDVRVFDEIKPQVLVVVQDASGNTVTGAEGSVSAAIVPGTGTPGANLFGGTVRPVQSGMATFDNLRIDAAGAGYQLVFTFGQLSVTSVAFNVHLFD